jgi:divalent metal cation (Fe/Co/Zn/Cd) transporter
MSSSSPSRSSSASSASAGTQLQSAATASERTQNILCAYLSLAILVGLGASALLGLWWADPLVALIVALVAIQAGANTWRGLGCDGEECHEEGPPAE